MSELKLESHTIRRMQVAHMKKSRTNIYIACEDMDFTWDEKEVLEVDEMWKLGASLWQIAKQVNRDLDEVVILLIDRCKNGQIGPRPEGIWGCGQ